MGLAPVNENSLIYEQHYARGDTKYNPEPKEKDSSHTIPPFPDPYVDPNPPPPPPPPAPKPEPKPTPIPVPDKNITVNCTDPANKLNPDCPIDCKLAENKESPRCPHEKVDPNKKDNVTGAPSFLEKNKLMIIIVGVSLFLCIIFLIIFCCIRRRKRSSRICQADPCVLFPPPLRRHPLFPEDGREPQCSGQR